MRVKSKRLTLTSTHNLQKMKQLTQMGNNSKTHSLWDQMKPHNKCLLRMHRPLPVFQELLKMNYTIAYKKSLDKYLTDNILAINLRVRCFSVVVEATAIHTTTVKNYTVISLAAVLAPLKPRPRLS